MQLGLIGLGRMGGNMRERLRRAGHEVVGYDRNPDVSDVATIEELVGGLAAPRVVWVMVPAQVTEETIDAIAALMSAGDLIIDGGNSKFTDDKPRADRLAPRGIGYLDCGVSGGVWGLDIGYGLMVGGSEANVAMAQPIFDALKPAGEFGFAHAGDVGAGQAIDQYGDGTTRRDYTYIDDIIQGVMASLHYEGPLFDIFNLGENETIQLKDLIIAIEAAVGRKAKINRLPEQAGDMLLTCADISKARKLLGYNPTTSLNEGLPKFVEWLLR
jgi:nucleoside-diphosphate-sugar epimerase